MAIYGRVRDLREDADKTQADIAKILGISTQTYNAWEKDISNVAIGKVKSIADFYGITIGEIFLPTDMKNIHTKGKADMNICNDTIETEPEPTEEKVQLINVNR